MEQNYTKKVKIYACVIQGQNGTYYWKDGHDLCKPDIGTWVIVENGCGYSLARVIGIMQCGMDQVSRFTNNGYDRLKNMLCCVDMNRILDTFNQEVKDEQSRT